MMATRLFFKQQLPLAAVVATILYGLVRLDDLSRHGQRQITMKRWSSSCDSDGDGGPASNAAINVKGKDNPVGCDHRACSSKKELFQQLMATKKSLKSENQQKVADDNKSSSNSNSSSSSSSSSRSDQAFSKNGANAGVGSNSSMPSEDATVGSSSTDSYTITDGSINISGSSNTSTGSSSSSSNCPLDREELGRSTWNLIHTLAAYYPENPSDEQRLAARRFIESLSTLYPCSICAEDFQKSVLSNPPRVSTREEFVMWSCQLHNEVNAKLSLPQHPCEMKQLDLRWRTGAPHCDISLNHDTDSDELEE